ncbi:hypothetical protein PTKIN_Ptkin04bG0037400 [Pterospermum kingtungense]
MNKQMVEHLRQYGVISSKKVAEVMEIIDRALFVPDAASAYVDSPMPNRLQCHHFCTSYSCYLPVIGGKFAAWHARLRCWLRVKLYKSNFASCYPAIGVLVKALALHSLVVYEFMAKEKGGKEGTGYLTACFAIMVGQQGRTVGVEHIRDLVASSIKNIEKSAAASLLRIFFAKRENFLENLQVV